MTSHYNIIIVAGGTGTRMQSNIPKQFLEIKGKPLKVCIDMSNRSEIAYGGPITAYQKLMHKGYFV